MDNAEDVRVTADLGDEDRKLLKSDFGDYCPVSYGRSNWLIRGVSEFESTINGKTYWFSGEKE